MRARNVRKEYKETFSDTYSVRLLKSYDGLLRSYANPTALQAHNLEHYAVPPLVDGLWLALLYFEYAV